MPGPIDGSGASINRTWHLLKPRYDELVLGPGIASCAGMGRAKAILQNEFPYNISARCINREWFKIPMDDVWSIFSDELNAVHRERGLLIHSFVLMTNHFHLIASTPRSNISECMWQFMHRSSLRLTQRGNRINQTFAGRHYKCVMHQTSYFLNAYKYVYRNPVAAGACERVEDYPYSTVQALIGKAPVKFPMVHDIVYDSDPIETLAWLNKAPEAQKLDAFKCGLHRQYFKSKKTFGKIILNENELL